MKRKVYNGPPPSKLASNCIFVCTTNTEGRHGKGNARIALNYHGAIYYKSRGFMGKSYGICTKDLTSRVQPSVSIDDIVVQIVDLYKVALDETKFTIETAPKTEQGTPDLTYVGKSPSEFSYYIPYRDMYDNEKNLNGYTSQQMAEMFALVGYVTNFEQIPANIIFENTFAKVINKIIDTNIRNQEKLNKMCSPMVLK